MEIERKQRAEDVAERFRFCFKLPRRVTRPDPASVKLAVNYLTGTLPRGRDADRGPGGNRCDDKTPAEADTIETLRALFRQQNPA